MTDSKPYLLTSKEAAAYIGTTPGTLTVWRCRKTYKLPYIKVGKFARYRKEDLDAFLKEHTVFFDE